MPPSGIRSTAIPRRTSWPRASAFRRGRFGSDYGWTDACHCATVYDDSLLRPDAVAPLTYDAIVVGSGISGGWAAKELTENGLRTIVLEAGRPIDPAIDYVEHVPPYDKRYRGMGDRNRLERYQPIQRQTGACDEYASKFFVNDLDNPYSFPADKPFSWIRGRQVGGRSIMWGRCFYRWRELDS